LLGVGYALILYYKESGSEFSVTLKWILAVIRTIVIALLAFLLLDPLIKSTTRYTEKPVIIFAQDNSKSIITNSDSIYYKKEYLETVDELVDEISKSYPVDRYTFGETFDQKSSVDFSEKLTDISGLFSDLNTKYSHRNVGALIIATDGIFNRGINPLYSSDKFDFPIYTVALGDTAVQRDVILSKVNYNRLAYLGNKFPLEVIILANKCINQSVQLTVSKKDTVLFRKKVIISSENYSETVEMLLDANYSGLQRYRIAISNIENEISTQNNYQDIFIDVLEGKQKILLLANSPHPDISALKQAVESNKNYEIDDFIIDDFDKDVREYNLIVLHGLPSLENQVGNILAIADEQKIPLLYIISKQTSLSIFNKRNAGVTFRYDKIIYNEAQPGFNTKFTLFRLSENTLKTISDFPPLISPYGNINLQPSGQVLFFQQIGSVSTVEPLLLLNESQDLKSGCIIGSGIWKWRLTNFAKEGNHDAFSEIINKIIQFLSVKVDRSFFRVYCKNNFLENEDVEFDAELYNDNYELINDPEVSITLTDSKGNKYPFIFNKTEKKYFLNAGKLPVDNYSFSARVNRGDKLLTDNGEFTVSSLSIEEVNTVANHNLLYNLASSRNGKMVLPQDINELIRIIDEREDIKPVIYTQKKFNEILNFPYVLILLIVILSMEWFIRKRAGAY
jgi:hypothetical protein